MKESIYLIGQISSKYERTYSWRQDVKKFFKNTKTNVQFDLIDPCDNEFNKSIITYNNENGLEYTLDGVNLIVPKDYSYVKRSSGCIADLNLYDNNKPMVGTMFELAWYHSSPEKFVVGVFDGYWQKDRICNHPFVRSTVDIWCKTHLEATATVIKYYERGL